MTYHADRDSARLILSRAELTGIDDSGDLQMASALGLAGETFTKMHRVQAFGLSSVPAAGAHGLMLSLSGRRDMAAILGMEAPGCRPRGLNPGETVLYDAGGNAISLVQRQIRIVSGNAISLKAPSITLEGPLTIKGDITHTGNMATSGVHTDANGVHK